MRRGTTPTLILNVTGEFTWSDVTELQVTIRNNTSRVTKTKNQVVWDGERSRLLIQLSQADTTLLSGVCEVQMRYQVKSGNAFATNIPQIKFERSITSNIIGEDIVHVRVKEIETDVEVQSNEDETTIDIEHGEVIEGEPRISDIEVNGQIVPIVEGIVSISIPTDINELQGTEEVRQALATLNGQTTSLENSLEQLSNKVDENASVVSNELVKVNEELQTNKERWTRQGTTNFETNERIGVLEDSDEDHEKRLSKAEASIVEHSNTLSQQAQEISKKASQSALNRTNEALANKLEASDMATINGQKITEGGNIIVKGGEGGAKQISELTDGYRVSDLENNKADKGESYTKAESDNKYLTEHQNLKTINGQSVVGEGNIIIEGGKGDVQSVSVNGGAKQIPDAEGNINLEIEEGGAKSISDLEDGNRVDELESAVSSKAEQSKLNETNTKVTTLEQEVGKFPNTYQKKLKAGANINIAEDGTISAVGGGSGGGNLYPSRGQQTDGAPTNKLLDDELKGVESKIVVDSEIKDFLVVGDYTINGFYRPAGTISTSASYRRTDRIDVRGVSHLSISVRVGSTSVSPVVFEDAQGNKFGGVTALSAQASVVTLYEVDVPPTAVGAYFSRVSSLDAYYCNATKNKAIKEVVEKLAKGVNVCYMSPNGDDTNDGLTLDTPVKTLNKVKELLPQSGTLFILEGDYYDKLDLSMFTSIIGLGKVRFLGKNTTFYNVTKVSGYSRVYSFPCDRNLNASYSMFQLGIDDEETAISNEERHAIHKGRRCRMPNTRLYHANSIAEIESTTDKYMWYFESNMMYVSCPSADFTNHPIFYPTANDIYVTGNSVNVKNIEFHGSNITLNGASGVLENVKVFCCASAGAIRWDECDSLTLQSCEVGGAYSDGINGHTKGNLVCYDCYGHDCGDDGESCHEDCHIVQFGGLYEYNGNGCTPASGASGEYHNTIVRKCDGSYAWCTDTTGTGFSGQSSTSETAFLTCVGCLSINNKTGFNATSTAFATLVNCVTKGNNSAVAGNVQQFNTTQL